MDQTWRSHQSGKQAGFDDDEQQPVIRPPAMNTLRKVRFLRSTLDKSKVRPRSFELPEYLMYRGTSLIRNRRPPWDHQGALGMSLL